MTKAFNHSPFDILMPVTLAQELLNTVEGDSREQVDAFISGVCCGFAPACEIADGKHKLDTIDTAAEIMRGFAIAKKLEENDD